MPRSYHVSPLWWEKFERYLNQNTSLLIPNAKGIADILLKKYPTYPSANVLRNTDEIKAYVLNLKTARSADALSVADKLEQLDSKESGQYNPHFQKVAHSDTEFVQDGDSATFKGTYQASQFDSIEAYIASKGVDLKKWKTGKTKIKTYQGFIKNKAEEIEVVTLNSFEVNLEARASFDVNEARDLVIQQMINFAPAYRSFKRTTVTDGHLHVLDPADTHFGKLARYYDTGDSYDLQTAANRVTKGFEGLLNKSTGIPTDKFLVILGNDMLHVDNPKRSSTAGTPQETDGMWQEAFLLAKRTFVEILEGLLCLADVDVVFNPSNHDYASGWMLFDSISSWFHKAKNIKFDGDLRHRKYYTYGQSMIGTTHGNGVKPANLMAYMPNEAKQQWAETTYRYWYYHHVHHMDKLTHKSGKDYVGGTVQSVRSISGTDLWHDVKGFNGVPKALESFLHSKKHGQVAQFTHIF